jgi:hypothetical protein
LAYRGSTFGGLSREVAAGYSEAIRLLLAYCAFESACSASGERAGDCPIVADSRVAPKMADLVRAEYGSVSEASFPLRGALHGKKLVKRLDEFFQGQHSDLQPIAAALRHLFAHGVWTPSGGRAMSKRARRTLALLSEACLFSADGLLAAYLAKINP